MPTFDYDNAQDVAAKLIGETFGIETGEIRRPEGSLDVVTGEVDLAYKKQTASIVTVPASGGTIAAFDDRFRELLRSGRLRFFMIAAKGLTWEPTAGDQLIYEGNVWEIQGATPLNPAGTPVYYGVGCSEGGADPDAGVDVG